ncbi:unnamed protein product [Adineta ricciae]|uniref:Uncharacterized protein n=1 Tax=Adineta ricciae TaxID=249248 RepID=A0A815VTD2_ADIRI|nr:unnamed protein product [Adineta ricciae]CAF1536312.1 unnamed protein product [Adineta ricciae]
MEQFVERLDTVLDTDPFQDIDWTLLSQNDCELLEKYRAKYLEDRKRIRDERKTKNFEQIMEDLLQELSHKPDISSFCRTLDDPLLTTDSILRDIRKNESDTSDDEQDDLEHCTTWIDPSKSIGRSIGTDELQTSTYVIYPVEQSPVVAPEPTRKIQRYTSQARRNTYTLQDSSTEDENDKPKQLVNRKHEYVRLDSEGFDPQQQQENPFNHVTDARSTFSIPKTRFRFTHREAQNILHKKLGAFIKGHLTRQLFRTDRVTRLIQTLHDTQKFAVDFQGHCSSMKNKLDPEDFNIVDQLIKQTEMVLNELHAIFEQYSTAEKVSIIARHRLSQQSRTTKTNQRLARDFGVERPIIEPIPAPNAKAASTAKPTEFRRPTDIRRHVSAAPVRSAPSTANARTNPVKKAATVQRKSRPLSSVHHNNESLTNQQPSRSSSANNNHKNNNNNNNIFHPPLRIAPASPMFRNRLK